MRISSAERADSSTFSAAFVSSSAEPRPSLVIPFIFSRTASRFSAGACGNAWKQKSTVLESSSWVNLVLASAVPWTARNQSVTQSRRIFCEEGILGLKNAKALFKSHLIHVTQNRLVLCLYLLEGAQNNKQEPSLLFGDFLRIPFRSGPFIEITFLSRTDCHGS